MKERHLLQSFVHRVVRTNKAINLVFSIIGSHGVHGANVHAITLLEQCKLPLARDQRGLQTSVMRHIKDAVNIFNFIHTLSSEKLAKILKNEQEKINKKIKYFIQVNISEESQKNGIELNLVNDFIKFCIHDLSLQIIGLMCLPLANNIPDFDFAKLKKISTENNLLNLSMGMSNDYVSAIRFGSTHVRIGSKIFGNRN